ncbi:MAG: GNAT family N-acetyltransferase [Christensenellaceae bacterium]
MDFLVREWQGMDYRSITKYANNKKIADNLRDGFPYPYTEDDAKQFVQDCILGDTTRRLMRAIEVDGEAAGSIGVFVQGNIYRKSAEVGYWLGEPFWGRGIVSGALKEICAQAFDLFDIVRIFAEPFAQNAGSRRALEKAGFTLEGVLQKNAYKNGSFLDSCMYALLKE